MGLRLFFQKRHYFRKAPLPGSSLRPTVGYEVLDLERNFLASNRHTNRTSPVVVNSVPIPFHLYESFDGRPFPASPGKQLEDHKASLLDAGAMEFVYQDESHLLDGLLLGWGA